MSRSSGGTEESSGVWGEKIGSGTTYRSATCAAARPLGAGGGVGGSEGVGRLVRSEVVLGGDVGGMGVERGVYMYWKWLEDLLLGLLLLLEIMVRGVLSLVSGGEGGGESMGLVGV